jgi:hypothetical protein
MPNNTMLLLAATHATFGLHLFGQVVIKLADSLVPRGAKHITPLLARILSGPSKRVACVSSQHNHLPEPVTMSHRELE